MAHLPFSIFKRKGRRFYYVQFKGEKGDYLPAISTKQITEAAAIETAFKWYHGGRPIAKDIHIGLSLQDVLRDITTMSEAGFICRERHKRLK